MDALLIGLALLLGGLALGALFLAAVAGISE